MDILIFWKENNMDVALNRSIFWGGAPIVLRFNWENCKIAERMAKSDGACTIGYNWLMSHGVASKLANFADVPLLF